MFTKSAVFTKVCWFFLLPQAFCRHCNSDAQQLKASSFSALTLCTVSLLAPFHTHSLSCLWKMWIRIISALHCACRASPVFLHSFGFWRIRGLRSLECPWRSEWKSNCSRPHQAQEETHIRKQTLSYIVFLTYNNTLRWGLGGRCETQLCPLNV
jgi:hypothetical protein